MHNGPDVGTQRVNGNVHGNFAGAIPVPNDLLTRKIAKDEVFRLHKPLADRGGVQRIRSSSRRMLTLPSFIATQPFS